MPSRKGSRSSANSRRFGSRDRGAGSSKYRMGSRRIGAAQSAPKLPPQSYGVGRMGIFLGWLVQKRWLTLTAFLLTLVGAFTLPRLPVPYSYLFVVLPAALLAAVIYEGPASLGLRISQKVRLAWALWMGAGALVLMIGIVLSNPIGFIVAVAVFAVMVMTSVFFVGREYARAHNARI